MEKRQELQNLKQNMIKMYRKSEGMQKVIFTYLYMFIHPSTSTVYHLFVKGCAEAGDNLTPCTVTHLSQG